MCYFQIWINYCHVYFIIVYTEHVFSGYRLIKNNYLVNELQYLSISKVLVGQSFQIKSIEKRKILENKEKVHIFNNSFRQKISRIKIKNYLGPR